MLIYLNDYPYIAEDSANREARIPLRWVQQVFSTNIEGSGLFKLGPEPFFCGVRMKKHDEHWDKVNVSKVCPFCGTIFVTADDTEETTCPCCESKIIFEVVKQ